MDFKKELQAITTLSFSVSGLHYDSIDDILYCLVSDVIYSIDTAATMYSLTWKSGEIWSVKAWRPSCVMVDAAAYPVTLNLYAEGSLVLAITVANDNAKKIPMLRPEQQWAYEIVSQNEVRTVKFGTSIGELR